MQLLSSDSPFGLGELSSSRKKRTHLPIPQEQLGRQALNQYQPYPRDWPSPQPFTCLPWHSQLSFLSRLFLLYLAYFWHPLKRISVNNRADVGKLALWGIFGPQKGFLINPHNKQSVMYRLWAGGWKVRLPPREVRAPLFRRNHWEKERVGYELHDARYVGSGINGLYNGFLNFSLSAMCTQEIIMRALKAGVTLTSLRWWSTTLMSIEWKGEPRFHHSTRILLKRS